MITPFEYDTADPVQFAVGTTTITVTPGAKAKHYTRDLIVDVVGTRQTAPGFLVWLTTDKLRAGTTWIEGVMWDRWLVLLGNVEVALVDSLAGTLQVIRLIREVERDSGFDRVSFHETEAGLAFLYECGAMLVDDTGTVRWHAELCWNDIFQRIEDGSLVFWTEFLERDGTTVEGLFRIRIDTGERV